MTLYGDVPGKAAWWSMMAEWSGYVNDYIVAQVNLGTQEGYDAAVDSIYYDGANAQFLLETQYSDPATYRSRALYAANVYNTYYLVPASYQAAGYFNFPQGFRYAFERTEEAGYKTMADSLWDNGVYMHSGNPDFATSHELSRECSYCLFGGIEHELLGNTLDASELTRRSYALETSLDYIDQWCVSLTASYFRPFMGGLTARALIHYYLNVDADSRIIPALAAMADYSWNECWVTDTLDQSGRVQDAFLYTDRYVGNDHDLWPQADLNMLIAPYFGFLWWKTGQAKWRERGDAIFAGAIPVYDQDGFSQSGAYLGSRNATNPQRKQWNQQLFWGPQYIEWAEMDASSGSAAQKRLASAFINMNEW